MSLSENGLNRQRVKSVKRLGGPHGDLAEHVSLMLISLFHIGLL